MLRCSISNAVPMHPVVGVSTGLVYEQSIIEKAIADGGKCPVTGINLSKQDLVPLRQQAQAQVNPPRSLDGTSIPSLLASFQNEWDAMALETFKLRQLLDKTRRELAQALYQHDAACRVIARLSKERDEARGALSTISINPASSQNSTQPPQSNGQATMKSSSSSTAATAPVPAAVVVPLTGAEVKKIDDLAASLLSARSSKRKAMSGSQAETLNWQSEPLLKVSGSSCCLDLDDETGTIVLGTKEGKVTVYDRATKKSEYEHQFELCRVSRVRVANNKSVLAACSDSKLRILCAGGSKVVIAGLKSAATDCCEHATKDFAFVVDQSGSWYLVRVATGEIAATGVSTAPSLCVEAHPDGKLFTSAGAADGGIDAWDVNTGKLQDTLRGTGPENTKLGPVTALDFSENGVSLSAVHGSVGLVKIWDMRKPQNPVHSFSAASSKYCSALFDPSGQALALAAQDGSLQIRNVQRTGAWPVALDVPASHAGLISAVPGRGSLLALMSNGVVQEWK